jgi:hypothetical protein
MIPARYDLVLQPGATFEGKVFVCLDELLEPVDIAGMTPMAKVRLDNNSPEILDLAPTVVAASSLTNPITYTVGSQVLTSVSHGLVAGHSLYFSVSGSLPQPLRTTERYIVTTKSLTTNTFTVVSFHSALLGVTTPIRILTNGTLPTFIGTLSVGQILIPEIADEVTDLIEDADAIWDLMIQDVAGRRLAPFMVGTFTIKRGVTP